jgi:chromosome segregation protein
MKIKKVEVCGFKSFVDRTALHIDHDVTAVVGPNGCGKSNIVDAIRWAMGEQSARHLRGKAMEDVIFNGSETRGPHSFAEVTLTFDNADGLSSPEYRDYAEIEVTRRLDRSGHSEYLINRTQVRLKDVTQLFLGTGVGTRAYSIIEQGRIGYIVSAKPTDRRHLIEEAAGITKFKAKKRAAERKMDQTRQNLLRVGDVLREIDKSLASLKRQAAKAERYKRYRSEIRDLELWTASHRWMELSVTRRVVDRELDGAEGQVDGRRLALSLQEAEHAAERLQLAEVEGVLEARQTEAYGLDNRVRLLEGKVEAQIARLATLEEQERVAQRELQALAGQRALLASERDGLREALVALEEAEASAANALATEHTELDRRKAAAAEAEARVAEARQRVNEADKRIARAEAVLTSFQRRREEGRSRLERLRREAESLAVRAQEAEEQAAALAARLTGLRGGRTQTAERRQELEGELAALREQIAVSDKELEAVRGETADKRSRLRSLEEITQRFEGVGQGVRAVMRGLGKDTPGLLGLVADRLDCPAEYTEALAAALGDGLQHIVVENGEAAERVLAFLEEEARGRATTIPREPRRVVGAPPAPVPGGVWLADAVGAAGSDRGLVRHLLGHVLVVEDLATARGVLDAASAAVTGHRAAVVVTVAGQVLHADGRVTAGRGEGVNAHMIAVKREIRELSTVVAELDGRLAAAVARHGELRSGIAARRAELDAARTAAHDAEIAIVKADKDHRRALDEVQRAKERQRRVEAEGEELGRQLEAADDEEGEAQGEIQAAQQTRQEAATALAAGEEVFAGHRAAVDEQSQRLTAVRVRAAEAKQRAESDRGALDRLERSLEELGSRAERLDDDLRTSAHQQGITAGEIVASREALGEARIQSYAAQERLAEARRDYDAAREALGHKETELAALRQQISQGERAVHELTMRSHDLSRDLSYLVDQMSERHRVHLPKVLVDHHARPVPDAAVENRVEELLRLVERMGEINLTAIEEYEETSQRHTHLSAQKTDLEDALGKLEKAIRQMNVESRKRFRETYEAVNGRFKQVFPKLFGGGRAELKLTDPQDLLETGVEIIAQPPGKRLGSIELMSGGEKALTAVSLIFSIFQYKPSPFCLLDEVDAPLDEANIGRFAEAIRAMTKHSQFIVITHSKATMQTADVLYGVTMETPGISKMVAVELRKRETATEAQVA